jgi:methylenetetrahydrofolate dehydrogenase (NADP+)/methenyltetrahydrofolate cyclohydrolase
MTIPSSSSAGTRARLIDGRAVSARIGSQIAAETRRLEAETGILPGLAVVLVGEDPASQVYVGAKGKKATELGFRSVQHTLPAGTEEAALLSLVADLNADPAIHGILVQLPLPPQIEKERVIEAISPEKDVDGLHPVNAGRLMAGVETAIAPCTPAGCMLLIRDAIGQSLTGLSAVVIGRSLLVGKPMANLLVNADCTVTVAHSRTRDLPAVVRSADIVVAAVGRPEMVKGSWVKPGATVIDVGMNRVPIPGGSPGKTRLVGDVAFAEAAAVAGAITPVPGGVGPMTIAMLMANTLAAACRSVGRAPPALH